MLRARTHTRADGCLIKPGWLTNTSCDPAHRDFGTKALVIHDFTGINAWRQVRETGFSILLLMIAILLPVFLVLSVTAVAKPMKTNAEHADDADAHRRGTALGRRKVGAVFAPAPAAPP